MESISAKTTLYRDIFLLRLVPLALAIFVLVTVRSIYRARKSPLNQLPGPWYAPYTTLHLQYGFATGMIWKQVSKAHDQYGSIVRMGPRQVWVSDKASLKEILLTTDLPKVAMYSEISRDRTAPGLFGEM